MGIPDYSNSLSYFRKQSGYTQAQVARKIGVKDSRTISKWERGRTQPDLINLFKLSALYGTLADRLYFSLSLKIRNEHFQNHVSPNNCRNQRRLSISGVSSDATG